MLEFLILLNEGGKVIRMLPHERHNTTPEGKVIARFPLAHIQFLLGSSMLCKITLPQI